MKTLYSKILTFVFISLSSFSLLAQHPIVRGTIYEDEMPISAQVSIIRDKKAVLSIMSDKYGKYALELKDTSDSTHIQFKRVGSKVLNVMIPMIVDDIELNVVLEKEVIDLDSVSVTATKSNQDYMRLDIFADESRSYFLNRSVEGMIAMMPGVSSTSNLSSQYQVRGGNFDENLVYINGIEVYRPLLVRSVKQEGISVINPDMVQSVGFSTGGFGAEYGDKMSSVLDISYKKPKAIEGRVGGSLMDANAYVGSNTKSFWQMTSIRYKTTESMLKSGDTKAEYKPSFVDFQTYMNYTIIKGWDLSLWGSYAANKYKYVPKTRTTNFGTLENTRTLKIHFNGQEDDRFKTSQGALQLKGKVNENIELNLSGSLVSSYEREEYDITGQYRLTDQFDDETLLGIGKHHEHARNKLDVNIFRVSHGGKWTGDSNQLKWGLEFSSEEFKDRTREWEMRDSTGHSLPHNENEIEMYHSVSSQNKIRTKRFSAYLQDRYTINSNSGLYTLTGGLRFHYWDFNEKLFLSPRLHFRYIPRFNENLAFHISGGLYHQAPFYREYLMTKKDENNNNILYPNNKIKAQKSTQIILGGDLNFTAGSQKFRFSTELYYKALSNMIPYTVNNVKIRYSGMNESKGYVAGIDFRLYGELVPETTSWISLSLMKTEQKIGEKKAPLPTEQKYMISAYIEDNMPGYERLKVGFKGVFADGLPFTTPNNYLTDGYFRTKSYLRADLALSWQVLGDNFAIRNKHKFVGAFKNIWLGAEVLNLFDANNVNTHYWVSDVYSNQFAIPNYFPGRKFNIRLVCEF